MHSIASSKELLPIVAAYKEQFMQVDKEERYKWEAIKWFQDHWRPEDPNFAAMIENALAKTYNWLASNQYYAKKLLIDFSLKHPQEVRKLFEMLFNEDLPLAQRFDDFRASFDAFAAKENVNHYQDLHAVSVYLTLRYPEKYFIYKYTVLYDFAYIFSLFN